MDDFETWRERRRRQQAVAEEWRATHGGMPLDDEPPDLPSPSMLFVSCAGALLIVLALVALFGGGS
jgi:hypothetical protein